MMRLCVILLAALMMAAGPMRVGAADYTGLVIFGDSLTDVGNADDVSDIGTGYYDGRYSNGPLWVEYLATLLGQPVPTFSLSGGSNYAFAGARISGGSNSLASQVATYLGSHTPTVDTLYILWGGGNDFLSTNSVTGSTDGVTPAQNMTNLVSQLYDAGAREFLVLNLPPLGQVPLCLALQLQTVGDAFASDYNLTLASGLNGLTDQHADLTIHLADVQGLFEQMLQNSAAYGFTVTTSAARSLSGINPDEYIFWDAIHPTTAAHNYLGQLAYNTLVPEPTLANYFLLAFGLDAALRRRRMRNANCSKNTVSG